MVIDDDYERITTGLTTVDHHEMVIYKEQNANWNLHFMERLNDYHLLFNSLFLEPITERLTKDGWGIKFVQFNLTNPSFLVDIYLDNVEYFALVDYILHQKMPKEIGFTTSYRGTLQDYLHS